MTDRYLLESGSPDGYLLEDGTGVLSIDATTLAIVNDVNMTVTYQGGGVYQIVKGGVAATYDAGAVSTVSVAGDFTLRLEPLTSGGTGWYGGGLNDTPTASQSLGDIDFLFFYSVDFGSWLIFENGSQITASVIPNATYAWIWRVGSTISYGRGATFAAAKANVERTTTSSATLYFDSTSNLVGATFNAYLYLPQDLVGTSSLTFAPSATLTGKGALSGTAALIFAPTATASGLGALSGTSTLTFSPASTLTGKGALTGASTIIFSPSATLTGKGALSGTAALTFAPSGALTGSGALSGTSALVFVTSGAATGVGALSGSSALSFASSGTTTGVGALSGSSALAFNASGTLAGIAPLVGTASITFAAAGTLRGIAYITGVASLNFEAAGTLTGISVLQTAKATRRLRHSKRDYPDKWGVWR